MGTALVQVAKALGHTVIATVGNEQKRRHVEALGADHVLSYWTDDLKAAVTDITAGRGVDLWLDGYGGSRLGEALDCMSRWGTLVLYNALGGHPPVTFFDVWRTNMSKSISVQYFSIHVFEDDRAGLLRLLDRAISLIRTRAVKPPKSTTFSLAEASSAHRLLESGLNCGRIFLKP